MSLDSTSEKPRVYSRSASQLNAVMDCSERYFLERFKKIQFRPAAWTARGIAIHDSAMEWEQSERDIDLVERGLELYDQEIEKFKVGQPDLSKWMVTPRVGATLKDIAYRKEDVRKQLESYYEYASNAEWEVATLPDDTLAVEVPFEITLGQIPIKGKVDLLLYWPTQDTYTIRDLKSGSERKNNSQLGLYRFVAQNFWGLDNHSIDYGDYYYTKLKEHKDSELLGRSSGFIDLRRYDEAYLTRLYTRANEIIQQKLFLPSPSKDCEMCPVMKQCSEMGWES